MVLTQSTMMPLGTKAAEFNLPDVVSGNQITLDKFGSKKALLIMFICRHCPYVVHVKDELARLGRDYEKKDIGIIAISSNDASSHPDDAPASLKEFAVELGLTYPLCYDETQDVAKSYTAACTPDFFLFDAQRKLVYRGQLDSGRPGNSEPVDGRDLREAIDATIAGQPVSAMQKPSAGCNIKWKAGRDPAY